MRAATLICITQTAIVIAYVTIAIFEPHTADNIALVVLFLFSFAVSRYSLYRVKQSIRKRHGIPR